MIVMKFGGSSLESAAAIERVAGIVRSRLAKHPVVVVSAMGKTTNALLAMAADAAEGKRDGSVRAACARSKNFTGANRWRSCRKRTERSSKPILTDHFRDLGEIVEGLCSVRELTPRSLDAVASYGERLSEPHRRARVRRARVFPARISIRAT